MANSAEHTTPAVNGSELQTAVPQQAASVEPTRPENQPESSPPSPPTPVLPQPGPGDLARQTHQQRAERLSRDSLIEAEWELRQRRPHPGGGHSTVNEMLVDEVVQRGEVRQAQANGSLKHDPLPRLLRLIPALVLVFDFGLLLYFMAGITNVDWSENPLSSALAFAIVIAGMITLLSYGFLSSTGNMLRSHKNDAGTIFWEDVHTPTRVMCAGSVVVIAALAVLMFTRMRSEVLDALGGQAQGTPLIIAVAISIVDAAANGLVVWAHAFNGSDQTARLNRLAAAMSKPLKRAHRLQKKAAKQANRWS